MKRLLSQNASFQKDTKVKVAEPRLTSFGSINYLSGYMALEVMIYNKLFTKRNYSMTFYEPAATGTTTELVSLKTGSFGKGAAEIIADFDEVLL